MDRPSGGGAPGALRDPGRARGDRVAVALGVARDPTDGHVDAETGGGALLLGLATPEAVLAVLPRPVAAGEQHWALGADPTGLVLAHRAGLRSLTGGSEEQLRPAGTRRLVRPGQGPGEDQ